MGIGKIVRNYFLRRRVNRLEESVFERLDKSQHDGLKSYLDRYSGTDDLEAKEARLGFISYFISDAIPGLWETLSSDVERLQDSDLAKICSDVLVRRVLRSVGALAGSQACSEGTVSADRFINPVCTLLKASGNTQEGVSNFLERVIKHDNMESEVIYDFIRTLSQYFLTETGEWIRSAPFSWNSGFAMTIITQACPEHAPLVAKRLIQEEGSLGVKDAGCFLGDVLGVRGIANAPGMITQIWNAVTAAMPNDVQPGTLAGAMKDAMNTPFGVPSRDMSYGDTVLFWGRLCQGVWNATGDSRKWDYLLT